jgi:hypothetical protein
MEGEVTKLKDVLLRSNNVRCQFGGVLDISKGQLSNILQGTLTLTGINTAVDYPPHIFSDNKCEEVRIAGKIIERDA